MSYDVYLECPTCAHSSGTEDIGPTYNLSQIFDLALTGLPWPSPDVTEGQAVVLGAKTARPRGLRILHGQTAEQSASALWQALRRLRDPGMAAAFKALEPTNGWGDIPGAVLTFERMLRAASHAPKAIWRIT